MNKFKLPALKKGFIDIKTTILNTTGHFMNVVFILLPLLFFHAQLIAKPINDLKPSSSSKPTCDPLKEESESWLRRMQSKLDIEQYQEEFLKLKNCSDPEYQARLGFLYKEGLGVNRDLTKALTLLQSSAEKGNPLGQCLFGEMHFRGQHNFANGQGASSDYEKSVYWFRKSAEQGLAYGKFWLGHNYEFGQGVDKDLNEAVKWYLESAEQGNAEGQYSIGRLYEDGKGIPRDYSKASIWYRKSADQGYWRAIKRLKK